MVTKAAAQVELVTSTFVENPGGPCGKAPRCSSSILPAAKSLFTPLNYDLRSNPMFVSLANNSEASLALLDLKTMILHLATHPTYINKLLHHVTDFLGYCNASAFGAGGVWHSGAQAVPPTAWRVIWPKDVSNQVISHSSP